ncbi:cytochrome b [Paraneptunicella aestuarii]|uniref:cytochrome b n=1 Tax=Paraneptunicella aestuarii TaxID=2831148 RepID=UPI001E4A899E|nr:cytochrome b [Paraneptunicella aestuarii]UAA37749.1 cytochrome b [Paraneptunicella aestuarii]
MIKNSAYSYGWISIILHWVSALTIVSLFALGLWMDGLDYYSEWYQTAPHWHKSTGILLAGLTLFRMLWIFSGKRPNPHGSPLLSKIARLTHIALYLILFAIFISGYLISTADNRDIEVFNWFSVPSFGSWFDNQEDVAGEVHELLAFGLIGLAIFHAAAALKHHFLDRDNTLTRMLKPKSNKPGFK